ncbi:hypothetical protein [Sphingomonas psychrotolerans]|uniref:Uncharacterized protein n=1 Tax=Sphingomonas psychrotolerans TaxID=1327635 RepID=A0A2K8MRZ2_9SPHN|nr:hypothetical protein [Sphingomonas psychrotolerans]ATY34251.1 hypothetical protein CVN68_21705 [Sphingomonas psychrotolerans]
MTDLQRNAFLHFEWVDNVVDIQEQFPLERSVTRRIGIAAGMGILHGQSLSCSIWRFAILGERSRACWRFGGSRESHSMQ